METASKIIGSIISASTIPLMALNLFAGIIGGIWLFVLGEWRIVILGLMAGFVFPYAYMIPSMIVMAICGIPLAHFSKKGKRGLAGLFGFLNMFILHMINLGWVLVVLSLALELSKGYSIAPYLLFGYSVATGPFAYMASKEPPDSIGSYVAVYLVQISYVVIAVLFLLGLSIFSLPLILLITLLAEIYLLKVGFELMSSGRDIMTNKLIGVIIPSLISTIMLLLAIPEGWPYGYYTLLRFVVCGSAIFIAYTAYQLEKIKWTWLMGFIALLFNPLIPIHLTKELWVPIDFITAILFIVSIFIIRDKKYEGKR